MRNDGLDILEDTAEHIIYKCPICGVGKLRLEKDSPKHYTYCDTCSAAYIDYQPLPHQMDVHRDNHKIKLLIGG